MKKKFEPSTVLRIKALIYRYTGIFLAYSDENEYIQSREFWKEWNKAFIHPENDMGPRSIQGLLIGLWQCHNGFTRMYSRYEFKRPRYFWGTISWVDTLYRTIKWDLKNIIIKVKK